MLSLRARMADRMSLRGISNQEEEPWKITYRFYGQGLEVARITSTHILWARIVIWPHPTAREAGKRSVAIAQGCFGQLAISATSAM